MISKKYNNSFGYIEKKFYIYVISRWVGNKIEPIYVGRGRRYRAKAYYKSPKNGSTDRYLHPKSHNPKLDELIAYERSIGREAAINAVYESNDLQAVKSCEKSLIKQYGRLDLGTGTLANRNYGG